MPEGGHCGPVRREHSHEISAVGEERSTAVVVVHYGQLVMDSTVQKRYGVGAVIEE